MFIVNFKKPMNNIFTLCNIQTNYYYRALLHLRCRGEGRVIQGIEPVSLQCLAQRQLADGWTPNCNITGSFTCILLQYASLQ